MRLGLHHFLVAALACGACGSNGNGGGDGGGGGGNPGSDGGGNPGGGDGGGNPGSDGGTVVPGTFSVSIGPIPLDAGNETVVCTTVRMPTTADVDIVRLQTALAAGSHHLIIYRSNATTEAPTPVKCSSFEGVMKGEAPIFIAESAASTLQLPTGVAYHFPAGPMVRLEAHYINTTHAPINGMGTVSFIPGAAGGTYQPADIMMCGSVTQLYCPLGGLAPNNPNVTLNPNFYNGNGNVDFTKLKIFAFTSHEHRHGSDVKIWKSTSNAANPAPPLFDNTSWDNPPLMSFGDNNLLTFKPGEGLQWQCSYDTTGETQKVCFGETAASNEMCFIWAYYYPSVGRFISTGDCWQ